MYQPRGWPLAVSTRHKAVAEKWKKCVEKTVNIVWQDANQWRTAMITVNKPTENESTETNNWMARATIQIKQSIRTIQSNTLMPVQIVKLKHKATETQSNRTHKATKTQGNPNTKQRKLKAKLKATSQGPKRGYQTISKYRYSPAIVCYLSILALSTHNPPLEVPDWNAVWRVRSPDTRPASISPRFGRISAGVSSAVSHRPCLGLALIPLQFRSGCYFKKIAELLKKSKQQRPRKDFHNAIMIGDHLGLRFGNSSNPAFFRLLRLLSLPRHLRDRQTHTNRME